MALIYQHPDHCFASGPGPRIASAAYWERAQRDGGHRVSTRGRTLDEVGFIHAGEAHQVAPVANAIYAGERGLLVLAIDPAHLTPEIRYERVPGWEDPFPHVYGPLDVAAVVATHPLEPGADGTFSFPAG
jgi:uncharacterized protein (DUF952 family)